MRGQTSTIAQIAGLVFFILIWTLAVVAGLALPIFACWGIYRLIKKYA